jgi:Cysteine-rich secretory protein family
MATLSSGQCLQPGQSLQSDSQLHTLIMQTDGNVVLYDRHSQMIWKDTTEVGCAIASGSGYDFLVCRYTLPGNMVGQNLP